MVTTALALSDLKTQLGRLFESPASGKVFIGFDGFVDKIKKAVREKQNTRTTYFDNIRDFSGRILAASGSSGQIQMDIQRVKLGGNGPILSDTFGKVGVKSCCLGCMGYPVKHPVFSRMNPACELISVLDPGLSDAVEFSDGKIIFSELEIFEKYDWNYIKRIAGIGNIQMRIGESALVAFVDWANLPHASNIWQGVLEEVIKPSKRRDFLFLFDLCDPSRKTTQQIDEVLDLISAFSPFGNVTLGLNENETLKIWCAISGVDFQQIESSDKIHVRDAGDTLYKSMNIDALLIHPIDRTILYLKHETVELQGRLVTQPKVLTGGGDNLNAGYCLGLLSGFSVSQCMLLGMAASGSYIENGSSPDLKAIIDYIDLWMAEIDDKTTAGPKPVLK